jgi:uncharacterized protein YndB with AHSA1/START domain
VSKRFEIRREVTLAAPPEEVWRAISTREGVAGWFMTFDEDPPGTEIEMDEPHRLEQRFGTQAIEYIVEAQDGGSTVLRFVHSGILEEEWGDEFESMTGFGWDLYLATLGEYLQYFPGRGAVYAEAEAPSTPDAWKRILTALGDPAEGEEVGGPFPGVVDIRNDHYLGIRTPDALVRFHERSAIGMAVAVGHHEMNADADSKALAETWRTWLAEAAS